MAYKLKRLGQGAIPKYLPITLPVVHSDEKPQLLFDVSELSLRDHHTGVQRVVRAILNELPAQLREELRPRVVRVGADRQLYFANRFAKQFWGKDTPFATGNYDAPLVVNAGDIFLSTDLHLYYPLESVQKLRNSGVNVVFVVYDLVAFTMNTFPKAFIIAFKDWFLGLMLVSDAIICDSRAVADELHEWLVAHPGLRKAPLPIGWFHLGADLEASKPTTGISTEEESFLTQLEGKKTLLMVGTLEPRKGHAQALDAIERLWAAGEDINLVLIGKEGWRSRDLIRRLRRHPQKNHHLFWLDRASDAVLVCLYQQSTALLAASYAEGFGLPLIEAARYGLPIIARDIPVFREVAEEHAFYFPNQDASALASAITEWFRLDAQGRAPASRDMPYLSWAESTQQLLDVVLGQRWYKVYTPDSAIEGQPES